jgi:hypothetical protein
MDVTMIPQGTGSGFVWDDKGHVVTNYHVVKGSSALKVTLYDSTSCSAKIVGVDENKDIAVLKLDIPDAQARKLRKVELGRSTGLFVGQKVFAIGNPFGLDHTLTSVRPFHILQSALCSIPRTQQLLHGRHLMNSFAPGCCSNVSCTKPPVSLRWLFHALCTLVCFKQSGAVMAGTAMS